MKHLRVIQASRSVYCPYQRKEVAAALCFAGHRSPMHPLCFGCADGATMEEQSGTRTFVKRVVTDDVPDGPVVRFRVRVNLKKRGVQYTYARLNKDGTVTYDMLETVVPGTMLTTREHHGLLPDSELQRLAKAAARERAALRGGAQPTSVVKARNNRRKPMAEKKEEEMVESRYFGKVSKPKGPVKVRPFSPSAVVGKKYTKEVDEDVETPQSMIARRASRLGLGLKKKQ